MANGSVYRRDDRKKPWIVHVSWHEGDRRRQSKRSYPTKKEAQAALAEIDRLAPPSGLRRADRVCGSSDFVETWINALETQGRKVSTIAGYRRTMKHYVLPRLGSRKLQDLRATDLDDLYADLLRSGGVKVARCRCRPCTTSTPRSASCSTTRSARGSWCATSPDSPTLPSMAAARDRAPDMNVWTPDELSRFLRYVENYRAGRCCRSRWR